MNTLDGIPIEVGGGGDFPRVRGKILMTLKMKDYLVTLVYPEETRPAVIVEPCAPLTLEDMRRANQAGTKSLRTPPRPKPDKGRVIK